MAGFRRYIFLVAALALVLSFTLVPAPKSAAATISLTGSVQADFPNSMTFSVHAESGSNITQLRLNYVVHRQNYAQVTSEGWAQFTPAPTVDTQWVWDMRKSGLPPGAQVDYWWTALDSSGQTARTDTATVTFEDDRFNWISITDGQITLKYHSGSSDFANTLMDAAQQGLQRIESNTGAVPQGNVVIYIYASAQELQGAQLFPPQWEGGVTFTGYDIIAIGVATNQLSFGVRAVPHELTHWIVDQITFNDYGAGLPTWLAEGLATYGEGTLSPDYQSALDSAIRNNQLLSVRSLSSPFSAVSSVAYISYGESNSIVTYLIDTYGESKMRQLLMEFQQGSTYDAALEKVYGFDQDGLDALWRQSLGLSASLPDYLTLEPALA